MDLSAEQHHMYRNTIKQLRANAARAKAELNAQRKVCTDHVHIGVCVLVTLLAMVLSVAFTYTRAKSAGDKLGYDRGLDVGLGLGHDQGWIQGSQYGYVNGFSEAKRYPDCNLVHGGDTQWLSCPKGGK